MVQTEDGDVELGDIIVSVNGEKVADQDALYRVLDKHKIGDTVNVEIIRRGRRMSIPVRLTEPVPARRRGMEENSPAVRG